MSHRSIVFFASHAAGGIRELWTDLGAGFAERGHAVELRALYPYELEPGASEEPGWLYLVPDKPVGLVAKLRMLARLATWLRRARPDVIITAMPAANTLLPLFARLFSPSTTLITTHHSPVETHNPVLDRFDSRVGRLGAVRAIVCVSDAVRASLAAKPASYRAKSLTIHNALPRRVTEQLAPVALGRTGRAEGRTVVAVGRLSEQKNYPMLIRAAQALPDVTIEILGGGPDEAELKALATELGVSARVRFLGQKDRAETLDIVSRADVFVQVSLFEGHSLALLEAATLGLPLIVSEVPSQREGVTASDGIVCAILVALGDDAALASAIAGVLDESASRAEWGDRALHLARAASFDAMLDRYDALIA